MVTDTVADRVALSEPACARTPLVVEGYSVAREAKRAAAEDGAPRLRHGAARSTQPRPQQTIPLQ